MEQIPTLPATHTAPETGWLEDDPFLLGWLLVSGREFFRIFFEAKDVLKSTGSKFVVVELDELPAEARQRIHLPCLGTLGGFKSYQVYMGIIRNPY